MSRWAFTALALSACFSPVFEKECYPELPCPSGYACRDSRCVATLGSGGGAAAGSGGGSAAGSNGGGNAGGASAGGGSAGGGSGGGAAACGPASCRDGCCRAGQCVTAGVQGATACGLGGEQCRACDVAETCTLGLCIPGVTGVDAGLVGASCQRDDDCGDVNVAFCIPEESQGQSTGFVGGYCSQFCEVQSCPAGAECVDAEGGNGEVVRVCLASCVATAQCRAGYFCDQQFCLP